MTLTLAIVAAPQFWIWWLIGTGHRAILRGQPDLAIIELRRATKFAPNNSQAHYLLAVAERRAGHLDQVSAPLQRAAKLGWPKEDVERQSLLATAQDGNVNAVDAQLKTIMARGVNDEAAEEIYEALAIGYLKTYRLKEAWECLSFWSRWQPQAIFPMIWRADVCRRINNRAGEELEYRAILAVDPKHCAARRRLAIVLKDGNRIDESLSEYEECLKTCPTDADLLVGLAECQRRLSRGASAAQLLKQALTHKLTAGQRAAVHLEIGQLAADEGRYPEAVASLEEAVRLAPFQPTALYSLSQAYARNGNEARSRELLIEYERVRTLSLRVQEITTQLLKTPDNADLRCEAGTIMMDLGLKEEGAGWLRTALQIQPGHQLAKDSLAAYEAETTAAPKRD